MSTHHPLSSSLLKLPTGYALMAKSCPITNLCLKSSVASYKTLNYILMLPMHLEKFEYEIGLNNEPFHPSDFLPGLLSQAASLKELKIVFKQYDPEWQDDDEPFIGSLSAMSALEILRAPLSVVLPGAKELIDSDYASACTRNPLDDLLPPNLTVLELAIGYLSLARFIGHTGIPQNLHLTSQCVPSLRTLEVSGDFDDHGVIHRLLKEVPKLNPPLNLILFNISNESLPSS
ncbi:hypothetical protein DL93DRAFT_1679656 [Clavulina sp. PMI_390]|nr:hypothetical protein DL93DRAFT_1679656 [Clavulina sp. PMI_390]